MSSAFINNRSQITLQQYVCAFRYYFNDPMHNPNNRFNAFWVIELYVDSEMQSHRVRKYIPDISTHEDFAQILSDAATLMVKRYWNRFFNPKIAEIDWIITSMATRRAQKMNVTLRALDSQNQSSSQLLHFEMPVPDFLLDMVDEVTP